MLIAPDSMLIAASKYFPDASDLKQPKETVTPCLPCPPCRPLSLTDPCVPGMLRHVCSSPPSQEAILTPNPGHYIASKQLAHQLRRNQHLQRQPIPLITMLVGSSNTAGQPPQQGQTPAQPPLSKQKTSALCIPQHHPHESQRQQN